MVEAIQRVNCALGAHSCITVELHYDSGITLVLRQILTGGRAADGGNKIVSVLYRSSLYKYNGEVEMCSFY